MGLGLLKSLAAGYALRVRLFRARPHMTTLDAVNRALDASDFDTAFDLIEGAAATRDASQAAGFRVLEAAVYALYGPDGLQGANAALVEAANLDPSVLARPLFKGVRAELDAYGLEVAARENPMNVVVAGDPRHDRAAGLAREVSGDPLAVYHAAAAFTTLGLAEDGLRALESVDPQKFPKHLQWRYWSWRGGAYEDLGRYREAVNAYGHAAAIADGPDRAALLLDKAAMFLELEEPHEVLPTLEEARAAYPHGESPADEAARLYLEARAHLELNNPSLAAERAERARRLEREAGEPSYGAALVHGQALATLEQFPPALDAFREAVRLAVGLDRGFALHEYGLTQMDADELAEARASLVEAASVIDYPHRGEVLADLAELESRAGNFEAAEAAARQAVTLGSIVPGTLMLASLAAEDYRFAEALAHYHTVAGAAPEGTREWVIGHEMIADTLVQAGWKDPAEILEHSRIALGHLEPSDEWAVTLNGYITRATALLGGRDTRNLN